MAAYPFDLRLKQSATFIQAFRIGPCNDPVDLAGYTARAHLRLTLDAADFVLELTTDNGGIVIDAEARTLTLNISDVQRDGLIALDEPRLVYDVFLTSPAGRSYPLLAGKVLVERSVTHD